MDRAVANASRSWFLALKPPVPLDPLARHIACPDLAEPTITPYMTEDRLPIVAAHCLNPLLAENPLDPCCPLLLALTVLAVSAPFPIPPDLLAVRYTAVAASLSQIVWDLVELADLDLLHLGGRTLQGIVTPDWALVVEHLDTPTRVGETATLAVIHWSPRTQRNPSLD